MRRILLLLAFIASGTVVGGTLVAVASDLGQRGLHVEATALAMFCVVLLVAVAGACAYLLFVGMEKAGI